MCISQAVQGGFRFHNVDEISKPKEGKVENGDEKVDQKVDEYIEKDRMSK
jgi:hypothetical protein